MEIGSLKVYIADDEPDNVKWLAEKIQWDVYNCEVFGYSTDSVKAWRYLEEHPIDLLFVDICMPGMTGLELIRRVKQKYPNMFIVVISAYDSFSYVREAFQYGIINYCLKPVDEEEIYECLKSVDAIRREQQQSHFEKDKVVFRNSVLRGLLNGESADLRFTEQCRLAGITLNSPRYQVALLDVSKLEEGKYIAVMDQLAGEDWKDVYCFPDGFLRLVILFMNTTGFNEEAESRIKRILRRGECRQNTFLCVGKPVDDYQEIEESYRVCRDFVNAGFLFSGSILQMREYPYERYLNTVYDKKLQNLASSLQLEQSEAIKAAVYAILDDMGSNRQRKAELICIAVFMVRQFHGYYPGRKLPASEQFMDTFVDEMKCLQWLEGFWEKAFCSREQCREDVHPFIEKTLQEIREGYKDSSLSLQEISKKINVSSAYLGRLFKEQTGEYFSDYLSAFRLNIAELLLKENKYKISEIVDMVGFASHSYFNRIFRKEYGVSPAEYRRKSLTEGVRT